MKWKYTTKNNKLQNWCRIATQNWIFLLLFFDSNKMEEPNETFHKLCSEGKLKEEVEKESGKQVEKDKKRKNR